MTTDEARAIFDQAIAAHKANPNLSQTEMIDRVAKAEICREYFCNPKFRRLLEYISHEEVKRLSQGSL